MDAKEAKAEDTRVGREMEAWVEAHGSARLKKALELGMLFRCEQVYREERAAREYPDWVLAGTIEELRPLLDIHNPSLEALEAFDDARRLNPKANLVYSDRRKRAVLVAPFLGRWVWRFAESDETAAVAP